MLSEVDVFISNYTLVDPEIYQLWVDGFSCKLFRAVVPQLAKMHTHTYPYSRDFVKCASLQVGTPQKKKSIFFSRGDL